MLVTQNVVDINENEHVTLNRTYEHKYMSNNWLKTHHKPKRRKPFTAIGKNIQSLVVDEGWLSIPNARVGCGMSSSSKELFIKNMG
ncbi:MAG: hypothetical protein BGO41_01285 [Clostridiales bacterium 38-18]|nr:MAG: hypothetical protein BGO41_01285 [Clostridiales bacterium 38-18]